MKKRISSLLLVLCMIFALLPAAAQAADYIRVGDLTYVIENGAARVSKCTSSVTGSLTVPETVNGYPVTVIGSQAFANCKLTSVTLPDSVTTLEGSAFFGCKNLTSVKLPSRLTSIGDHAFDDCMALTGIAIPGSVTRIDGSAFSSCTALESITLPDSVTTLGAYVFYDCTALKDAKLPSGLTIINNNLFDGCTALTDITIPSGVTSIGKHAFEDCSSLKSVTIPASVKTIDQYAFKGCSSLTSLTLQEGVEKIEMCAFENCDLRALTIPTSVTSVASSAFSNNPNLPYVKDYSDSYRSFVYDYHASVIIMQGWCGEGLEWGLSDNGRTLHILGTGAMDNYASAAGNQPWELSKKDITAVVVHEGVTGIGNYAFHGSDMSIRSVQLPQSLQRIGDYAFEGQTKLTAVELPEGLKTIGRNAFAGTGLTTLTIPASVTALPVSAFDGCRSLRTVWLPETLTQIASSAFRGDTALTDVYYLGVQSQWTAIRFGMNNEPLFAAKLHCKVPGTVDPFVDVPEGTYYAEPVKWAVEKAITNGTSPDTFSPENTCTRAQVVTFLWRAAGSPTPEHLDDYSFSRKFQDVWSGQYYYSAVIWAMENDITNGTTNTTFSPNDPCTRAHVVTFLWRAMHSPAMSAENPFTDVPPRLYYSDAVLWAVAEGITNGTTPTTFSPGSPCTRAQIVTFLYRTYN